MKTTNDYRVNDIIELVDYNYVDCCNWVKVGDRYIITDIKDGRVMLRGLFRNECTTLIDLELSFKLYDRR